ncbi:peptidoglycan DD-metalloendopeptidase family protein [Alteromonas facilis]|uniref:peptidoglycan DD-metalloendopeptidase family protein n=1 Tax=Alteromonas facilis TaxID=2048004 RepID=UPI000C2864A9|nr:peptidoglycan DD-metalloendopeptidase family protein [Alteromonas facilis]
MKQQANASVRKHRFLQHSCLSCISGLVIVLSACSSQPHTPAPVVSLDMSIEQESDPFEQDTYTVQPGDTLFAIAWYSGNDYRDIARYNQLQAPYLLKPGDIIRLTPTPVAQTSKPQRKHTTPTVTPQKSAADTNGRTSTNSHQSVIDRSKEQAYGDHEKDVKGQQVSRSFPAKVGRWVWPAEGNIIGRFSAVESGNKGVDIANQQGTPIVAAAEGKVVYTGEALRGYGRLIIIKHTDTFLSAYAHNDRILVSEQQWVKAGEQIGTMGSSGTDKVMLHFEVRYRGKSLDPMRYLPRQ